MAVAGEKQFTLSDLALGHTEICGPQIESFWVVYGWSLDDYLYIQDVLYKLFFLYWCYVCQLETIQTSLHWKWYCGAPKETASLVGVPCIIWHDANISADFTQQL